MQRAERFRVFRALFSGGPDEETARFAAESAAFPALTREALRRALGAPNPLRRGPEGRAVLLSFFEHSPELPGVCLGLSAEQFLDLEGCWEAVRSQSLRALNGERLDFDLRFSPTYALLIRLIEGRREALAEFRDALDRAWPNFYSSAHPARTLRPPAWPSQSARLHKQSTAQLRDRGRLPPLLRAALSRGADLPLLRADDRDGARWGALKLCV